MDITLNGIPISDEQCIGDSLPIINGAFATLKNAILQSSSSNDTVYLKKEEYVGYFPLVGGIVKGGVQIGTSSFNSLNSASILRFGLTSTTDDGDNTSTLPSMFSSSHLIPGSGIKGNDFFINANSANGKILFRTGVELNKKINLIVGTEGLNVIDGNLCVGSYSSATDKLEVYGNAKITSQSPTLVLKNNIGSHWNSKILFKSNETPKLGITVDSDSAGSNNFKIYDYVAAANRFEIRSNGYIDILGNVGIGGVAVSNRQLKVTGDFEVTGDLYLGGNFNSDSVTTGGGSGGIDQSGAVTGTTGTFSGKVTAGSLQVNGDMTAEEATFSGYTQVTSPLGIQSTGPIKSLYSGNNYAGDFNGKVYTKGLKSDGDVEGEKGTFTGKITTTSTDGIQSSGPIKGTSIEGTTLTCTSVIKGTRIIGDAGTFSGPVSGTTGMFTSTLSADGNMGTQGYFVCNGLTSNDTINVDGSIISTQELSGFKGTFSENLKVYGHGTFVDYVSSGGYTYSKRGTFWEGLSSNGTFRVAQGTYLDGSLGVGGYSIFNSGFTVTENASVSGNAIVGGSLTVTGCISCDSDIIAFQTSDERLKKNITPITQALDKVTSLNGCEFEWNEELTESYLRGKSAGFIAQEVEKVFPQAVMTRDNGYKAIRYEYILPLLVEAIKDLQDEVEDLKSKLKS